MSKSHVTWISSVPILVFLGLFVLDLGPMYATDREKSDRQTSDAHHHLIPPTVGAGHHTVAQVTTSSSVAPYKLPPTHLLTAIQFLVLCGSCLLTVSTHLQVVSHSDSTMAALSDIFELLCRAIYRIIDETGI